MTEGRGNGLPAEDRAPYVPVELPDGYDYSRLADPLKATGVRRRGAAHNQCVDFEIENGKTYVVRVRRSTGTHRLKYEALGDTEVDPEYPDRPLKILRFTGLDTSLQEST